MEQNLNQELESLIAFFWHVQKLSFSKDEYSNIALLEKNGLLKFNGNEYAPANYALFASRFLEYYRNKNAFIFSSDFYHTVSFIRKLKNDFLSKGYVHEFYYLNKEIWKLVIVEANKQFHVDFFQYLNALNKDGNNEEIFEFIGAYNDTISELDIKAETLYKNAVILKLLVESDATYNLPLSGILLGLKKKSESNENIGAELFQFALQNDIQDDDIISAIVAGLYNKLGFPFYQESLENLLASPRFKVPVINGLSNIDNIESIETDLFIKLFDREKHEELSAPVITKLLFSILTAKNDFPDKDKYVPELFSRINEIVLSSNEQLGYFILHEIAFLHKYDSERIAIVRTIIDQPYFSIQKFGKSIAHIFRYLKDVNSLKIILVAIADKSPFEKISSIWLLTPNGFDKNVFDEMFIELISNNKASIRFIGLDIFNHCSLHNGYKFDKNILDLPPIVQYKLLVGLTQDYKEPKHLIPALVPLLDSKSGIVKEAFISKLEEYTENYGREIIEILEEQIAKSREEHVAVIKRIENYRQDFYARNILVKKYIQELNPFYTHNKLFNNFIRLHQKTFNAKMKKSVEEHSFLSTLAKNVQLAKGGGWKIGGRNEISKLGHFESGFLLPRDYFIFPNYYEMEESAKMRRDWIEEEFALIKQCIDDEQQ